MPIRALPAALPLLLLAPVLAACGGLQAASPAKDRAFTSPAPEVFAACSQPETPAGAELVGFLPIGIPVGTGTREVDPTPRVRGALVAFAKPGPNACELLIGHRGGTGAGVNAVVRAAR